MPIKLLKNVEFFLFLYEAGALRFGFVRKLITCPEGWLWSKVI